MIDFKKLRWQKMMNATEVSRATGVSCATISQIEHGSKTVKVNTIQKLADFYDVDWREYYND